MRDTRTVTFGAALGAIAAAIVLALAAACGGGDGGGTELTIVSQNILHGILDEDPEAQPNDRIADRIPLISEALAEVSPDVVFLQEVLTSGVDDYPEIRGSVLTALGDEYRSAFGNIQGDAIDTLGLGQLTVTRLPILASENRHIGGVRAVHWVQLETDAGPVDVYNAHLEGTGAIIETGENESVIEIRKVLDFIEETSGGGPVIFAGDFNAEPGDPSISEVLGAGFIDVIVEAGDPACAQQGDPGCTNSTKPLGDNPGHNSDQRIDYVFVRSGGGVEVEVEEAELFLGEPVELEDGSLLWASDHIGVRTVLRLK